MEAVLKENSWYVQSIVPTLYSAKSTAEKQAEKEEKQRLREQAKLEKVEARQEKKDNKVFETIREEIRQELLGAGKEQIQYYIDEREKFSKDMESRGPQTESDDVKRSIDIANGARGTESASDREKRGLITNILKAGCSVGTITALLTPLYPAIAPFIPMIITVGSLGSLLIGSFVKGRRINKRGIGEAADTLSKEDDAKQKIEEFLEKVEKLDKEIEKDKIALLEAKKTMNKDEFQNYLKNYVGTLKEKFEDIGKEVVEEVTKEFQPETKEQKPETKQSKENIDDGLEQGV